MAIKAFNSPGSNLRGPDRSRISQFVADAMKVVLTSRRVQSFMSTAVVLLILNIQC